MCSMHSAPAEVKALTIIVRVGKSPLIYCFALMFEGLEEQS